MSFSSAWGRPLTQQNRVLAAGELKTVLDKTVFYVENQDVWLWAFGEGTNPAVFDRENTDGSTWASSGGRGDECLFHVAVLEAVMSDPHVLVANDVPRRFVDTLTAELEPWHFVAWWPGLESRLWRGDDVVAMTGANQSSDTPVTAASRWFIFVGARTERALGHFDRLVIGWDYDSRTG